MTSIEARVSTQTKKHTPTTPAKSAKTKLERKVSAGSQPPTQPLHATNMHADARHKA